MHNDCNTVVIWTNEKFRNIMYLFHFLFINGTFQTVMSYAPIYWVPGSPGVDWLGPEADHFAVRTTVIRRITERWTVFNCGGTRLCPCGTSIPNGPIVRAADLRWMVMALVQWYLTADTEALADQHVKVPLYSPQISHGLPCEWTKAWAAVRPRGQLKLVPFSGRGLILTWWNFVLQFSTIELWCEMLKVFVELCRIGLCGCKAVTIRSIRAIEVITQYGTMCSQGSV
jgi:hypothetical protein